MPSPDEVKFIRWWREYGTSDGLIKWHSYYGEREAIGLNLIRSADHGEYGHLQQITPRGRDLVATADAIGFDPDAVEDSAEPEVPECSECGGSGRVAVIGSFTNPCRACNWIERWAAEVGRQMATDIEAVWSKPSRTPATQVLSQPMDFDEQPGGFTFRGVPISPIRRLPPPIVQVPVPAVGQHVYLRERFLGAIEKVVEEPSGVVVLLVRQSANIARSMTWSRTRHRVENPAQESAPPVVSSVLNSHRNKKAGSLPDDPGTKVKLVKREAQPVSLDPKPLLSTPEFEHYLSSYIEPGCSYRATFGKWQGQALRDMPTAYLQWMQGPEFCAATVAIVDNEIAFRESAREYHGLPSECLALPDTAETRLAAMRIRITADGAKLTIGGISVAEQQTVLEYVPLAKQAALQAAHSNTSAPDLPDSISCPNPRGIDPNPPGAGED